ncbi:MAG: glycoside hydrolase N-terminal domain-containing protein, partial [Arcanobacterium sp.]|nr:glycoside hydrolase N-terminal domain-containing protein [Arcanobacterium sp.]
MKAKLISFLAGISLIAGVGGIIETHSAFTVLQSFESTSQPILRYLQPASQTKLIGFSGESQCDNLWQQTTLPLGNGDLGATVYGEVSQEKLVLNEKTLWTGGPGTSSNYHGGNSVVDGRNGKTLAEIRANFETGASDKAANLAAEKLVGGHERNIEYGGYQGFGELLISQPGLNHVENYQRELDLERGIARVKFNSGHPTRNLQILNQREYFASNPDDVVVGKISLDPSLPVFLELKSYQDANANNEHLKITDRGIELSGKLHNNGLNYGASLRINKQAEVVEDKLKISGSGDLYFVLKIATDYKNEYPAYRTGENLQELMSRVTAVTDSAINKSYESLRTRHEQDFVPKMQAMDVDFAGTSSGLATDELLTKYRYGELEQSAQRFLEALLHTYGRYLLLSSSRENSQLPANLQGLWAKCAQDANHENPWRADYHMNVNLQMNYWPAHSANLSTSAFPLLEFVENLVQPGRETAKVYAGTEGTPGSGFMSHTENTPYGWTTPGNNFYWGWSPAAVPWILQNLYQHYEFTNDKNLLAQRIYPLLKETAQFYVQKLLHPTVSKFGVERLVSTPTFSPEHGPITDGNTYEQSILQELFDNAIQAAQILGIDSELVGSTESCGVENWQRKNPKEFAKKESSGKEESSEGVLGTFVSEANRSWDCARSLLKPIELGSEGQIKEWYDEGRIGFFADGSAIPGFESGHRHLSHLLGVYPGKIINEDTPNLLEGAKISLRERGIYSTGWGLAQRLGAWARVGEGEAAYQLVMQLLKRGTYPNLFDAHPPFQIDGNLGYTAAVNEMLLQSHTGKVQLLPALPQNWGTGAVHGIRARGGFEFDFRWNEGELSAVSFSSEKGGELFLQFPDAGKMQVEILEPDSISVGTTSVRKTVPVVK